MSVSIVEKLSAMESHTEILRAVSRMSRSLRLRLMVSTSHCLYLGQRSSWKERKLLESSPRMTA